MGQERIVSFWLVCRAVSTESRLRLLWTLFEKEELCVGQLAEKTAMKNPVASAQLKILYSSGLIRFRRKNMNVIYRAEASGQVDCAADLLNVLRKWHGDRVSFKAVIRQITAFTHERRIEIVRVLKERPLSFSSLQDQCGMTSSALSRHLLKLEARGFVRWDGKRYRVVQLPDWPGRRLLDIACSEKNDESV